MAEQNNTGAKSLQKAGDVRVNSLKLSRTTDSVLLDLLPFMVEINIYEDIFTPALYGNIAIRDTQNLVGTYPIVGDEVLYMDIETPGLSTTSTQGGHDPLNKIEKAFSVYAVKDRRVYEDKEQNYILHFCSLEAVYDNITRISKKYSGTTDEIISNIWEEHLRLPRYFKDNVAENEADDSNKNVLLIGDTPHTSKVSFVAPMWSPIECISWLAKRSIGTRRDKAPTFLFYETTKGYYCVSLEDLIANQIEAEAIFSEYVFDTHTHKNNLENDYSNVENIRFKTNLDILQSQDLGHFTSSLFTFDLIKKQDALYYYDHSFGFKDNVHLEAYKKNGSAVEKDPDKKYNMLFPFNVVRSANSKPILATLNPGVLDSTEDSIDLHPDQFISQRLSKLMDINTLKLEITVPGRTDIEVGRIIRFWYPAVGQQGSDTESRFDVFISGLYIITAIHHQITQFRHTMTLEIAKDSYANPILDVQIPEEAKGSVLISPGGNGNSAAPAENASPSTQSTTPAPTGSSSSPTGTSGNATPAPPGSKVFVFGDSIGVGVQSAGSAPGSAHGGDSPKMIFDKMTTYLKNNSVRGATILLSSGASNGAKYEVQGDKTYPQREFEFIAKQIQALKTAGASKIILLGTASGYSTWFPKTKYTKGKYRVDLRGVNEQLSQIARNNGAEFTGPLEQFDDMKGDGLHPFGGYNKIWKKYSGK